MPPPDEIPTGAVLRCECGTTVADLSAWAGHATTHDGAPEWSFIDSSTAEPIEP